jgi:hypothetical protein
MSIFLEEQDLAKKTMELLEDCYLKVACEVADHRKNPPPIEGLFSQ